MPIHFYPSHSVFSAFIWKYSKITGRRAKRCF